MFSVLERAKQLKHTPLKSLRTNVVYVMWRDVRVKDNYAMVFAQALARQNCSKFFVANYIQVPYLQYGKRHYKFYLEGVDSVHRQLDRLNISMVFNKHDDYNSRDKFINDIVQEHNVGFVVFDFNPLPYVKNFVERFVNDNKENDFCVYVVDTHNVVPCWLASDKREYSAKTFRSKVTKLMSQYLTNLSVREEKPSNRINSGKPFEKDAILEKITKVLTTGVNNNEYFSSFVRNFPWMDMNKDNFYTINNDIEGNSIEFVGGEEEAEKRLKQFVETKLATYELLKNDPVAENQSNLSPYINFGQLSSCTVCKTIYPVRYKYRTSVSLLIEQIVVRKELSDNFFHYSKTGPDYDLYSLSPQWAVKNHQKFKDDKREHIYTLTELENSQTTDLLWNAANNQMKQTGHMHGYLRMYWAKRMITWTKDYPTALSYSVYLNDKYSLDGNDVNGLVGCLWSICAVHDRPFFLRPVFGNIRSMTNKGVSAKFDACAYIEKYGSRKRKS